MFPILHAVAQKCLSLRKIRNYTFYIYARVKGWGDGFIDHFSIGFKQVIVENILRLKYVFVFLQQNLLVRYCCCIVKE